MRRQFEKILMQRTLCIISHKPCGNPATKISSPTG
uniref:Uncharacterized protein n=1 Tax=Rhizophora mucronata TaxID=61149 RepID=A0A2P2QRU3_RHIMU